MPSVPWGNRMSEESSTEICENKIKERDILRRHGASRAAERQYTTPDSTTRRRMLFERELVFFLSEKLERIVKL